VQLIRAGDGLELWSRQFDGQLTSPNRFTVQDQIASEVVQRLPGGLRLRVFSARRPSPEAEPLFWEAQSAWQNRSTDNLQAAESLFRQAIETDPGFARAWVGLARVYVVLGGPDYATRPTSELYPLARESANRALELDPDLWEAHAVLGNCAMSYDWDWDGAEGHFWEAIGRNESYTSGLQWYSNLLMYRGRSDEAFELAHRALATSDSKYLRSSLARHYAVIGEPRTAIKKFHEALELDRGFRSALIGLAFAKLQAGDIDAFHRDVEAMAASVARSTPTHRVPLLEAMRAHALGKLGRSDEAIGIIGWLEAVASEPRAPSRPYVPPEFVALASLGHGDNAHALDWLERAAEVRSHVMPSIMVEPVLAALRGEPRFTRLLERVHGPLERFGARRTPPAGTRSPLAGSR
jgi:serine/threonine-protein kinase